LSALGIVLLLALGVSRLVGGGGDDSDAQAARVSSETTQITPSTSTSPSTSVTPSTAVEPTPTPGASASATPTLPAPTGRCSDDDIVVAPSVTDAQATKTVLVHLTLRTLVTTACTWRTSPKAIQLKITSGSDLIWTTIECPHAVPT